MNQIIWSNKIATLYDLGFQGNISFGQNHPEFGISSNLKVDSKEFFNTYVLGQRTCISIWFKPTRQQQLPRKLQHTPISHTPGNLPSQLWKESLYSPLVKVAWDVFQRCVETTLDLWVTLRYFLPPGVQRGPGKKNRSGNLATFFFNEPVDRYGDVWKKLGFPPSHPKICLILRRFLKRRKQPEICLRGKFWEYQGVHQVKNFPLKFW